MIARIPYEGLAVNWINPFRFTLTLPWISLEVDIEEESDKGWISEAVQCLIKGTNTAILQRFLNYFEEYPISYIAPRTHAYKSETTSIKDRDLNLNLNSPQTLVTSLNSGFSKAFIESLPNDWIWSPDMILNISRVAQTPYYDPLTVVTYLIGKRLLVESTIEEAKEDYIKNLNILRLANEPSFFKAMSTIITQTYYITRNIERCVIPAFESFPEAKSIIEAFLSEEKGHDKLMERSLRLLSQDKFPSLAPFESVVMLLDVLKYAAYQSPLSFTCLIGCFEGAIYGDTDPFSDLLLKSSRPEAAKGYAIHHQINMKEQHSRIIYELAERLKCLTQQEVLLAIRLTEFATILCAIGNYKIQELSRGAVL